MSEPAETLGERLKAAREAKGVSVPKAAHELHLDPWVIEALESGDYARIGPSVYVKGHLKRYAALVGLVPADILDAYTARSPAAASQPTAVVQPTAALQPASAPPAPAMRLQTSRFGGASGVRPPFAGLAAVALVLAGVYWWMNLRPRTASMPGDRPAVSRTAAPGAVSSVADGAPPAVVDSGDGASDRTGDAGSGAPTAATAIQGPRMAATVAAHLPGAVASGEGDTVAGMGPARLRLSFSADAWVDVHDAAGRRLYAGNGRANSVKIIAGIAPMKVYIGFASGVQLQVNNRVVAIGPQFVAGDVARFEAGADGVLRRDARPATASNPHPRG